MKIKKSPQNLQTFKNFFILITDFNKARKSSFIQALSANNQSDIRVFAVLLHAHNTKTGIRIRHLRDGMELPPIAEEHNGDPNFEEYTTLPKEIIIQGVRL